MLRLPSSLGVISISKKGIDPSSVVEKVHWFIHYDILDDVYVPGEFKNPDILGPRHYDSFALAIFSKDHREINIAESISANSSHNHLYQGGFLIMS